MSEKIKFLETGSIKFLGMFIPFSGEIDLPVSVLKRCEELLVVRQCNCMQLYCGACRMWDNRNSFVLDIAREKINKCAIANEAAYRESFFDSLVRHGLWQQAIKEAFNILLHNAKHSFHYRDGDDSSILIADKLSGMERTAHIQEMLRGQISLCKQKLDEMKIEDCSLYMSFKGLKPADYAKVCRGLPYVALLSMLDEVMKEEKSFKKFISRLRETFLFELEKQTGM